MSAPYSLRPAAERDAAFLLAVYSSTREEELAAAPWTPEQKALFLRMQFDAQARHYAAVFPRAERSIILRGGEAAGRLYVDRAPGELRIIDIAILPAHRGAGIGGAILRALLDEAARAEQVVVMHVERNNRARRLYERLGFRAVEGGDGVYDRLEWRARVS